MATALLSTPVKEERILNIQSVVPGRTLKVTFLLKEATEIYFNVVAQTGTFISEQKKKFKQGRNVASLKLTRVPPGPYFLLVRYNGQKLAKKFYVE